MKTKIVYLVSLLCALTFATSAFADSENGFYEKNHVRGFISVGADYRGMFGDFHNYVNTIARYNGRIVMENQKTHAEETYHGSFEYAEFYDYYLGLHMNIGAQYKQFLTWFNINAMPTQISERPSKTYNVTSIESGDVQKAPLFDVKWFTYGVDWMFGWKLFGENTVINLIPAVGVGFNLINFHFASLFTFVEESGNFVNARDRYYSTMDATVTGELELRLEINPIAIGIYGGYRHVDYSDIEIEEHVLVNKPYDTDNSGDTWFVGVRATWTFKSDWQRKQADKL
ncbi:MAG: hypothetical protein IK012_07805 [Fibrobacter sp.]|uniref:hypothetical protein n=1 Tax=Fibrobacter sp. TaxID=35828 RepID=UPI0025BF0A01|nr:hypothetical protein [Fibrobacter sp.]MBR4785142.1 hypothetical protein [Fibrobacter sp.]